MTILQLTYKRYDANFFSNKFFSCDGTTVRCRDRKKTDAILHHSHSYSQAWQDIHRAGLGVIELAAKYVDPKELLNQLEYLKSNLVNLATHLEKPLASTAYDEIRRYGDVALRALETREDPCLPDWKNPFRKINDLACCLQRAKPLFEDGVAHSEFYRSLTAPNGMLQLVNKALDECCLILEGIGYPAQSASAGKAMIEAYEGKFVKVNSTLTQLNITEENFSVLDKVKNAYRAAQERLERKEDDLENARTIIRDFTTILSKIQKAKTLEALKECLPEPCSRNTAFIEELLESEHLPQETKEMLASLHLRRKQSLEILPYVVEVVETSRLLQTIIERAEETLTTIEKKEEWLLAADAVDTQHVLDLLSHREAAEGLDQYVDLIVYLGKKFKEFQEFKQELNSYIDDRFFIASFYKERFLDAPAATILNNLCFCEEIEVKERTGEWNNWENGLEAKKYGLDKDVRPEKEYPFLKRLEALRSELREIIYDPEWQTQLKGIRSSIIPLKDEWSHKKRPYEDQPLLFFQNFDMQPMRVTSKIAHKIGRLQHLITQRKAISEKMGALDEILAQCNHTNIYQMKKERSEEIAQLMALDIFPSLQGLGAEFQDFSRKCTALKKAYDENLQARKQAFALAVVEAKTQIEAWKATDPVTLFTSSIDYNFFIPSGIAEDWSLKRGDTATVKNVISDITRCHQLFSNVNRCLRELQSEHCSKLKVEEVFTFLEGVASTDYEFVHHPNPHPLQGSSFVTKCITFLKMRERTSVATLRLNIPETYRMTAHEEIEEKKKKGWDVFVQDLVNYAKALWENGKAELPKCDHLKEEYFAFLKDENRKLPTEKWLLMLRLERSANCPKELQKQIVEWKKDVAFEKSIEAIKRDIAFISALSDALPEEHDQLKATLNLVVEAYCLGVNPHEACGITEEYIGDGFVRLVNMPTYHYYQKERLSTWITQHHNDPLTKKACKAEEMEDVPQDVVNFVTEWKKLAKEA